METFADVATALATIQGHAACAEFVELPNKYIVYYPFPGKIPGGAIIDRNGNELQALTVLYATIDQFWKSLGQ